MEPDDYHERFTEATNLGMVGRFQESLSIMNEVFLFHPEGALAYKYYYRALVDPDPKDRIKELERADEGFKSLLKSVGKNIEKTGMDEVHNLMLDHYEGLKGARRSTREEFGRRKE